LAGIDRLRLRIHHDCGVDPFLKIVTASAIAFMSLALVGLAMGLGARYPRFGADNATQWYSYREAMPAPMQESVLRSWTAWLMPDRETELDPVLRRQSGEQGRAWLEEQHGYLVIARRLEQIYTANLESARPVKEQS
jgi:hypothetical protein